MATRARLAAAASAVGLRPLSSLIALANALPTEPHAHATLREDRNCRKSGGSVSCTAWRCVGSLLAKAASALYADSLVHQR